ncbi:MAG: hypothetical protein VW339_12595, partial [Quisquiliibacterium sp.]
MRSIVQAIQSNVAGALLRWGLFVALLLAFILVPFFFLEGHAQEIVEQTLGHDTSVALIALAVTVFLLLDIALPIPSSFVLSSAGYLLGIWIG